MAQTILTSDALLRALACTNVHCPCHRAESKGYGLTHCPSHDPSKTDKTPSLSVSARNDAVLWSCKNGCDQGVVTAAIHALFPLPERRNNGAVNAPSWPAKVYDYGTARHLRQDNPDGTKRMWWEPRGTKMSSLPLWNWELLDTHRQDRPDEPVLFVEGEKAADAAVRCGFTAVSLAGGAGQRDFGEALKALSGLRVVQVPDLDEPGTSLMDAVATAVSKEAVEVRRGSVAPILDAKGADVADLLVLTGGNEREARKLILSIIEAARPVQPTAPSVPAAFEWEDFNDLADEPDEEMVSFGLFSEGTWIIAGAPKLGKSWFALSYAHGLSIGGAVLGSIQAGDPCVVRALILEDGRRRYKKRIKERVEALPRPERGMYRVRFKWPRLDQESLEKLEDEIQLASGSGRRVVVVIDTGTKLRPLEDKSSSIYMGDYNFLDPLTEIAQRYHCLILVIAHTRKAVAVDFIDAVIGSHGISGAVDGIAVLARERHSKQATLEITGRDGDEQKHYLQWDAISNGWLLTDEPDAATETRQALLRRLAAIKAVLSESGKPMGLLAIRMAVGMDKNAVKEAVDYGVEQEEIERVGKGVKNDQYLYALPMLDGGLNEMDSE